MSHGSMFNPFGDEGKNSPANSIEKAFAAAIDASSSVDISLHDISRKQAIEFMDAICLIIGRTYQEHKYDVYSSFEMVSHDGDKIVFTCYTPFDSEE